jgi:hypothetical protein
VPYATRAVFDLNHRESLPRRFRNPHDSVGVVELVQGHRGDSECDDAALFVQHKKAEYRQDHQFVDEVFQLDGIAGLALLPTRHSEELPFTGATI